MGHLAQNAVVRTGARSMNIRINRNSQTPIYLQIKCAIQNLVLSGELNHNLIKISTPMQPPSGKDPGGGLVNTRSRKEGMTKARSILREKRI